MSTDAVEIRREQLDSRVATTLIGELNAELTLRYPEDGATHFRLDPDEVAPARGAFLVAWSGGEPVGCGAIRKLDETRAEIKRMYVKPSWRGRGVSRVLLSALEGEARRLGVSRVVLETGTRQHEALGLYRACGYTRVEAFGEYVGSPLSVCMEKRLSGYRRTNDEREVQR